MNPNESHLAQLLDHLLALDSREALDDALRDLLTPAEYAEIVKRLQILRMLGAGVSQRKIAEELGVGIATVTRGARALKSTVKIHERTES
jgi:TrpR family trp operon transcriptional repressor